MLSCFLQPSNALGVDKTEECDAIRVGKKTRRKGQKQSTQLERKGRASDGQTLYTQKIGA